jgi:hypothetical protein
VDYALITVGDHEYVLPVRAVVGLTAESQPQVTRNAIAFGDYGKFSSESTLSFGDDAAQKKK